MIFVKGIKTAVTKRRLCDSGFLFVIGSKIGLYGR